MDTRGTVLLSPEGRRALQPGTAAGRTDDIPGRLDRKRWLLAIGPVLSLFVLAGIFASEPGTALVATGAFASTNVDGFVAITALLALDLGTGGKQTLQICLGQALGLGFLATASILTASLLSGLPASSMALLAAVPIWLGLRTLHRQIASEPGARRGIPSRWATLAVAAVVISGGADNLAVYTPLFHGLDVHDTVLTLAVFMCLTVLWGAAAYTTSRLAPLARSVNRHGLRLAPYGYLAIGAAILLRSLAG